MSDSAGTLWLDVKRRTWFDAALDACGLDRSHMPTLHEGTEISGTLNPRIAAEWGMGEVPVAGGGGDNAAGAIGAGVIQPGQAFLSLGTSGVYFVACESYQPNPDEGVHTFCHAIPKMWNQMSVILSAASCLTWVTKLTGAKSEGALLEEVERETASGTSTGGNLTFLPYLSGERTPHNDPNARGVFFGMTHETSRVDFAQAVLEGVAFAFVDGQDALLHAGTPIGEVSVIGGGARSAYWGRILASALQRPLVYREGGALGPAFGAARLARIAVSGEAVEAVCTQPVISQVIEPDPGLVESYTEKLATFRKLYRDLKASFS
jgi:xylulokinase